MENELIIFFNESIKSEHWKQRADLLSEIHCSKLAKAEFESEYPGKEHAWDSNIERFEEKVTELDLTFAKARDYLKSMDKDKIVFRR